jgi:hypothetical protein
MAHAGPALTDDARWHRDRPDWLWASGGPRHDRTSAIRAFGGGAARQTRRRRAETQGKAGRRDSITTVEGRGTNVGVKFSWYLQARSYRARFGESDSTPFCAPHARYSTAIVAAGFACVHQRRSCALRRQGPACRQSPCQCDCVDRSRLQGAACCHLTSFSEMATARGRKLRKAPQSIAPLSPNHPAEADTKSGSGDR